MKKKIFSWRENLWAYFILNKFQLKSDQIKLPTIFKHDK